MEDVWDSHPRLYHLLCLASFECCSTIGNRHGYLVYCSLGRITLLMDDTTITSSISASSHTFGMDRNYPTFVQHSSITHAGPHVAALCRPLYAQNFEMVVRVHSFVLAITPKCNLPPNASAKFLSAKILPEDSGTSKSEVDELQNDRIQRQMDQNSSSQSEMTWNDFLQNLSLKILARRLHEPNNTLTLSWRLHLRITVGLLSITERAFIDRRQLTGRIISEITFCNIFASIDIIQSNQHRL